MTSTVFGQAAAGLFITQPALSRQIRRLEAWRLTAVNQVL